MLRTLAPRSDDAARELFDGQVSASRVRQWRTGLMRMPPWARQKLADRVRELLNQIEPPHTTAQKKTGPTPRARPHWED
jgi:hypothetical protein